MSIFSKNNQNSLSETEKVLSEARQKAAEIISDATAQADRILKETKLFSEGIHEDLQSMLEKGSRKAAEQTQAHLDQVIKVFESQLNTSTQELENVAKQEIVELRKSIQQAIVRSTSKIESESIEQQKVVGDKLRALERRKAHQLTAQMNASIPMIVNEVVGRSISLADHEQIIRDALQEAKDDGLWKK